MKKRLYSLFTLVATVFITLLLSSKSFAQYHFDRVGLEVGLNSEYIWSIGEDTKGNLWLGSINGLVGFDGRQVFEPSVFSVDSAESLPNSSTSALKVDNQGALWVGLQNQIAVLRPQENQFRLLSDLLVSNDIVSTSFSFFHQLPSNNMLAAAAGTVFLVESASLNYAKLIDRSAESSVVGFFRHEQRVGVLFDDWWVAWFSEKGELLSQQQSSLPQPYQKAYLLTQTANGSLMVAGIRSGIFSQSADLLGRPVFLDGSEYLDSILTLGVSPDGMMLIGTQVGLFQGELKGYQLDLEPIVVSDGNTEAQYIYTSYIADDNTLLLGTDRGLYRGTMQSSAIQKLPMVQYKNNPDVYAVAQDDSGNLWVSSGSLVRFDTQLNPLPVSDEISSLPPAAHILNAEGVLWVSHQQGLSVIDPIGLTREDILIDVAKLNCQASDTVSAYHGIYLKGTGQLAFSFNGGIIKIAPENRRVEYFPLGKGCRPYATLAQDINGSVYTSRANEIWQLDEDGTRHQSVVNDYAYLFLFNNPLSKLDSVLITTGAGIKVWHKESKSLSSLGTESNNWVSVLDSTESLWVSTLEDGIHRVNKSSLKVRYYRTPDGLLNHKYNINGATVLQDGRLAFAGENGLDLIEPKTMPDFEPLELKVSSVNYDIEGSRQVVLPLLSQINKQDMVLPANATNIEFWLTTSSHRYAGDYRFRYRLQGLSPNWQTLPQGTSKFALSSLPIGVYSLDLSVQSPSGAKQTHLEYFRITIAEPSWAWWYNQAFQSVEEFFNIWVKLFRTAPLETVLIYIFFALLIIALIILWVWASGKKKQKKLQGIIKSKTAQISSQNQELEYLLNYRQELLANIAHELKTPLTLMLGVLTGKYDDTERKRKLNRLIFRISHLLDNMLDLSSIKKNDRNLNQAVCYRAHEFVEFYLTTYRGFVAEDRLNLVENQTADVFCPPDTLDKLITNLINNAIKYSPANTPINIEANVSKGEWHFYVENQGKGIAPEQLHSVFQRYVQIDEGNRSYGLGLGLPLVKQLVESAGGRIEIESELNKTTRVSVFMPLATDHQLAASEARGVSHDELSDDYRNWLYAELNQPTQASVGFEPLSDTDKDQTLVFCIDDNVELLSQLQEQLGNRFLLRCFSNPVEALDIARQQLPDLIVSDLMMPQLSGIDVVSRIREDELLSHIPVVLLTARSDHQSKNQALLALADDYVTKPYEPNQLALKIDNLVAIRRLIKSRFSVGVDGEDQGEASSSLSVLISDCRPDQKLFMQKVIECLQEHLSEPDFSIKALTEHLNLSDSQIRRKVKAISGYSPQEVLRIIRLEAAASMIRQGHTLKAIAYDCGFSSQSHMGAAFKAYYGQTPKEYGESYTG